MPFLVIDDDGPARARNALLRRNGALARVSSHLQADAGTRYAMIADTCMLDAASTARIRELMQGSTARFVARTQGGVMAPIHAPDFQAMADRLTAK